MTDLLPFVVVGVVTGSVFGIAGIGLVLTYKTSGIFNFAHGAVAAAAAYLFYSVRDLQGAPWPIALIVAVLVFGPLVGIILEWLARGLAPLSSAAKIVATVGLMIAIQGLLFVVFGTRAISFAQFLPEQRYEVSGVLIGLDQLLIIAAAVAASLGLYAFFRSTRSGTAMRAVVEDPELLDMSGTSPVKVRRWSWVIGASFAAVSGVLLAPSIGLDPNLLTLLVVQAFGAAAVGGFASLPLTYVGGLVIGVFGSLATRFAADVPLLTGVAPSVPFVVLFVALLVWRRGMLVEVGRSATDRLVTAARTAQAHAPPSRELAIVTVVLAAMPLFFGVRLNLFTNALVFLLIFASLRLLVTTSGQVSLAHIGFAAVGATTLSHLTTGIGLPWGLALLLAGLVAVPVGAFVAIPAIRLAGLYLALATFGFGVLLQRLVYRTDLMFGGGEGALRAARPELAWLSTSDTSYFFLTLAIVVLGVLSTIAVQRIRLGRFLHGLADSPLLLTTNGLNVNVTRVLVFCLSAFLAAIAGGLLASLHTVTSPEQFAPLLSVQLVVVLFIFEVITPGVLRGPLHAALLFALVPALLHSYFHLPWLTDYEGVIFGVTAILAALASRIQLGARAHVAEDGGPLDEPRHPRGRSPIRARLEQPAPSVAEDGRL